MTRPTTTGKAQDLITFTRSTTGTALAKISYGEELVTNGTFDTNTSGWTSWDNLTRPEAASQVNGKGLLDASVGTCDARQDITVVAGKTYSVSVTMLEDSGASGRLYMSDGANYAYAFGSFQATGTETTFTKTITPTQNTVRLYAYNSGTAITYYSNITVKEVLYDQPDGTLQLFNHPINKPRIEYDAEGNCLGLLVEEARTNVLTYSEDFSNGAWSKQNASITANTTVSPDGTLTGDKLIGNSATVNTEKFTNRSIYSYAGQTVTGSVYVKKAEYTWVQINLYNSGAYSNRVWVNLDTGAVGTNLSSIPVTVTPVGDSWYRVVLTATIQATGLAFLTVALADADGDLYTNVGDQYSGTYLWGAQLEQGSFPTSYIPTSGSAVTRAADVASLAVSEFGYNQDQGSVVLEAVMPPSVISEQFWILGSNTNSARWAFSNSTSPNVNAYDGASIFTVSSLQPSATQKMAIGTDQSTAIMCLDGVSGNQANTNGNISSLTTVFYFGGNNGGAPFLNGHIKSIQYYPLRLSNAQLQALTV